jgi:hypothetical protein
MQVSVEGYAVVHELAVSNLLLGIDVSAKRASGGRGGASVHQQGVRPGAVARPATELRPDLRPWSERRREVAPLAAGSGRERADGV